MRSVERGRERLVGRDEELRRLISAIGSDRPTVVVGEAGIGKTTLVRAAVTAAGIPIHEGGGFATLASMPYLALRRAVGTDLAGDPARVASIVERHVGPDVLFIDDLQWVDPASVDALACLVGRVLIISAIRTDDAAAGHGGAAADRLALDRLQLGALADVDARDLVIELRPDLGSAAVDPLLLQAGGNPLLLQALATSGGSSVAFTRLVEASLDRLSPEIRRVVDLLAVVDRPVARARLGTDGDASLPTTLVSDRHGARGIRHGLLAAIVRDHLEPDARRAAHERAADVVDDPVEVARHLSAAGLEARALSIATSALERTVDPISRASLLLVVADSSPATARSDACLVAARALGDLSDWVAVMRVLSSQEAQATADARAERAALLGHAAFSLGRQDEARAYLEAARAIEVDPMGPVATRIEFESIAFMVNVDGDLPGALARLDALCAEWDPASPSYQALRVLRESVAMLLTLPVDLDLLRSAVEAAIAAGSFAWAADLARVVSFALLISSGAEPGLRWLDDVSQRFEAAGVSGVAEGFRAERVQATLLAGRPADAVTAADELMERPAPLRARQAATIFRAKALMQLGHLDDAESALATIGGWVTDDFVGRGEWLAARVDLALWGGVPRQAIQLADAVHDVPSPIVGAYGLTDIARAWAQHELGMDPEPVTTNAPTRVQAGAGPELAGLGLLHEGRMAEAADRFAEAAALWAGFNEPRAMVCRWAEGDALRQAGRLEAAGERLTAALEVADRQGFELVAGRIRRSMRQAGWRPSTERSPTPAGMRLTPREAELLRLAGRGLTNIEIARRMGLGRPTVARILSNAMVKLGAESRAQAVAQLDDDDRDRPPQPRAGGEAG